MKQINFTLKKKAQLRKAYENAVKQKKEVFVFEKNELYTPYAKYLLQYLDHVLL